MAVQYFDSDFSFEEHARECAPHFEHTLTEASELALGGGAATNSSSDDGDIDSEAPDEERERGHLHPTVQSECWDAFHSSHSHGNFFKSRRYITKCFFCLLDHPSTSSSPRIFLEIGSGSGSCCVPLIKELIQVVSESSECTESPQFALLACDSSPVAVETTKRCVQEATKTTVPPEFLAQCFNAFVADPSMDSEDTSTSLLERTKGAYQQIVPNDDRAVGNRDRVDGIADVILCVFVLSAVDPAHAKIFIRQVYESLLPGAYCCFRDYGMFDLPMMRFPSKSYQLSGERDFDDCPPRLFVRGDGTLSRFFHCETVQKLFEEAGYTTEELRYATVFNINRKTKQKLKRVFVNGIFRKPAS